VPVGSSITPRGHPSRGKEEDEGLADILNVLAAWITVFSLVVTVVAAVAYRRVRNQRVLLVAVAFALFTVKGVLLTLSLGMESFNDNYLTASVVLDTVVIVLLATTVLKR
jgi:uncharacterized membrane protein YoaK (UPF0700 family)